MQPRFLVAAGHLLLAFLLTLAFASCTGGDAGKGKKKVKASEEDETSAEGDGGSSDLLGSVQDLLEEAKKGGAAKSAAEDLEKVQGWIDKAQEATEKGKDQIAEKNLKLAKARLTGVIDEQKKGAEALKKLAADRSATDEAKKKAELEKAAQNAPEPYKRAEETYKKALELMGKGTASAAAGAKQLLVRAKDDFEQAATIAKESKVAREQAEVEKKEASAWKEKAKAKGADEKASAEFSRAGQAERDADGQVKTGEFAQAKESYRQAAAAYQEALRAVQTDEENAKMEAAQAADQKAYEEKLKREEEERRKKREEVEEKPEEKEVATPKKGAASTPPPSTSSIPLPEGYDPQKFPNDLDAEDEAFLVDNIKRLTPSGAIEYDPATGAVSLDYREGKVLLKDALVEVGRKEYCTFKPPDMPNDRNLTPEDKKKYAPYSFSGNTSGTLWIPVPLRYYAKVEWYMQILTMNNSGTFGVHLLYDAKKKNGYYTSWCMVGTTGKPSAKGVPPKFRKTANEWFDKKIEVPMVVEYKMADPKTGTLTNIYNNDDSATEKDDKLTTQLESTACQRGLVGFWWNGTKFSAKELKITGILDKQAAVEKLRKELKKPRAKPTADKSKEKDKEKAGEKTDPKAGGPAAPGGDAGSAEPEGGGAASDGGGDGGEGGGDAPKKSAGAAKKPSGAKAGGGLDF